MIELGINDESKNFPDILETWEKWKDRPQEFTIGGLGEPTKHPEFLDLLADPSSSGYTTDGVILGTPKDPRRGRLLDLSEGREVKIKMCRDLKKYQVKAIQSLSELGVKAQLLHFVRTREEIDRLKEEWPGCENLFYPALDINQVSPIPDLDTLMYEDLYILKGKKIYVMKSNLDLRPIKIIEPWKVEK